MKKKILVGLFAICAIFGLVACSEEKETLPTVKSLSIEGQLTEFQVGDEFDDGDLKVTATLSDGTTIDVTDKMTLTQDADMSTPGSYAVLVSYEGIVYAYQINVVAQENVETLKEVVIYGVDTEYVIGDEVSLEGAVAYEAYENTEADDSIKEVTDLSSYSVIVYDYLEQEVTGAFTKLGTYQVVVSKGTVSYSYTVEVKAKVYASVAEALAVGLDNADKVAEGTATVDNGYSVFNYTYAFGDNYTKVSSEYEELHYQLLSDGSPFGLSVGEDWEGNPTLSATYEPRVEQLLGVDFQSVFSYQYEVFGVEALVETFNMIGKEETSYNYSETFPDHCEYCGIHNLYSFSFEMIVSDFYYYFVTVEFSLNPENGNISEVKVNEDGYYLDTMVLDEENNTYSIPEEVTSPEFAYVVSVSQTAGERNAVIEYNAEDYLYTSFELTDAENNTVADEQEFEIKKGESLTFNVINVLPNTANPDVDPIDVSATDANGESTWSVYGSYYDGVVNITAYAVGDYIVTVSTALVTKTVKLSVNYAELTSFAVGVYDEMSWALVEQTEVTAYVGNVVQFGALVNENANNGSVAVLKTESDVAVLSNNGSYDTFAASEVGTYVIELISVEDETLKATLTVTVVEAPSMAEILVGTYQYVDYMWGTVTYVFTPETEGAEAGILTIEAVGGNADATGEFEYSYSDGYITVVPTSPASSFCYYSVTLDANFNLVCTYNGWEQGLLSKVENSGTDETTLNGTYSATFVHPMNNFSYDMVLIFYADGKGSYDLMNNSYIGAFSYSVEGDVITFSEISAVFGNVVELSATLVDSDIVCTAVMDGNPVELTYTNADSGSSDETTTEPVVGTNKVEASYYGVEYVFTPEEDGTYIISVDESVAVIGVEGPYGLDIIPSTQVTLTAGQEFLIVVMTNDNNGTQVVELTIEKA